MADMKVLLAKAAGIIKKKMAVLTQDESLVWPEGSDIGITYEEACKKAGSNYKGFNIYASDTYGTSLFLCISAGKYYESEAAALAMLLLASSAEMADTAEAYLRRAVEGKYDAAQLAKLEEKLVCCLPGHLLLIDDFGDYKDEVLEILVNSMEVKVTLEYDNRLIAIVNEDNIAEACGSFIKNVLSELLIECSIVIGGRAACAKELHGLYENCSEALCLKQVYGLADSILNYEGMYGYRIAYNLNPRLKELISRRVFTEDFREMVNGELGNTIEEFFKNNLNLTDTAAKLYIHRNTLLYRLDKIHKSTGFDLKRFEDSWLFKLAWMIYKENSR
ncbi:MAG TPA: helix-turn-helix domain-containing protein [Candidatus Nitrosocosmicus sp.]|nr:helix-turn-helix domain-containing protein [Candidatus Nitrosocosmicus sp.]